MNTFLSCVLDFAKFLKNNYTKHLNKIPGLDWYGYICNMFPERSLLNSNPICYNFTNYKKWKSNISLFFILTKKCRHRFIYNEENFTSKTIFLNDSYLHTIYITYVNIVLFDILFLFFNKNQLTNHFTTNHKKWFWNFGT